jgi:hypothetical protein
MVTFLTTHGHKLRATQNVVKWDRPTSLVAYRLPTSPRATYLGVFTSLLTSVNPVHNAQVCYFNNLWLMFLVFSKNFFFQTTVRGHCLSGVTVTDRPSELIYRIVSYGNKRIMETQIFHHAKL